MSGPIRPSGADVVEVISIMRSQLPNAEVFLCTWTGHATPEIRKAVDHLVEVPEPTEEEIDARVFARTGQQRESGLQHWTYSIYRMIHGVHALCEFAKDRIRPEDIVLRIRTDTPFHFQPNYLGELLRTLGNEYIIRNRKSGGGFDDWFAITRFFILQNTWTFEDYNASVAAAWNAEDLVFRNLRYPVRYLDNSKVECYIKRPNGERNYHA